MTELTVKHDPATGAAVIEIRGVDIGKARFRLRDPYTEKFLTKRGWTKAMSFLPGEAKSFDGVTSIALDADLARKLTPGINLILEQPVADFEEIFTWPSPNAPVVDLLAEIPEEADDPTEENSAADATTEIATATEHIQPTAPLLEPFEPTVEHGRMHEDAEPSEQPRPELTPAAVDNDNRGSGWKPALIAAFLFFVFGLGLGYFWLGSNSIKQERQTAAIRLEKQKSEFDLQLKQAKAQAATVAADRDTAQKARADQEKSVAGLQAQLKDANSQIDAVKNAAGDQAKAQIDALDSKIAALTGDLDKANGELAARDAALRDAQAKLSVANVQLDTLKVIAGKNSGAGIEKTALSEKLAQMSAELDKTSQSLSDREQALTDTSAKLRDAETKLAAASKRNEKLAAQATADPVQGQTQIASSENPSQTQQERDLYASELKTMTGNFTALQAEKTALEKTVADLKSQLKDAGVTTTAEAASSAIWGATAIDQSGAIYSLQNQTDEKLAQVGVIAKCRNKSGSRCEPLASYNNACLSVARIKGQSPTPENYAYFIHKSWKTASQTALERCESMGTACTVRFIACSPDGLSRPSPN